jgi:hypothetical protein
MKTIVIFIFSLLLTLSVSAQQDTQVMTQDTTPADTIVPWTGNMLGLNVYPAFGMLSGGVLPASKIFFQYRHMWEKTNLRFSLNYINFFHSGNRLDIVDIQDTTIHFREFGNNFYTLDFRVGIERAYHMDNFRFYYGLGIIGGYHHFGKSYSQFERDFTDYPIEGITSPFERNILGWYRADMFKAGFDITLGVDIPLSENVIMSIQYAPEMAYFKRMGSEKDDPAGVFDGDVDDFFEFRGDFVDIVLSVGF